MFAEEQIYENKKGEHVVLAVRGAALNVKYQD